jgi:hypothetical protein
VRKKIRKAWTPGVMHTASVMCDFGPSLFGYMCISKAKRGGGGAWAGKDRAGGSSTGALCTGGAGGGTGEEGPGGGGAQPVHYAPGSH